MRRDEVLETPRMARASASLFASDVVAALAYFAFALLVARLAGPAARGAVAFVTAVPLLLAYASTLGLDAANLFHAGREPALRPVLVTASAVVCVLAGSAFAAAAWGVFDLSPGLVPGSVSDALLAAGLAITGLMTVQIALDAALIGSGETASANLVRIVVPITAVVLYAGTAAVTGRSGAAIAVAAWVVSRAAGCVLALVLSARRIGLAGPRELRRATPRLLRYGLPAHVGSLADLPIRRFDTLMLGASRGAAELGIYTAAVNGAEVMFYLPTAAGSVLLPAAAPLDAAAARSLTRRVLLIVVTATGLAAAFVAATAPFLVRVLFGPEFAESVLPLRILALGVVGASIRIVLEGALLARRRQALSSAVTVLTLVVIVALDVVLIPRYGAVGAAAASTAAYWVAAVFMYAAFRRAVPRDGAAPRLRDEARSAWAMVASLVRRPAADTPLPPGPVPLAPLPERPLVSVLVSSYCYAQYLGDAIESVLGQTYERFEVVVCDDGSTDGSRAVLEEYARRDARVVAVTKENGGQASALNAAFRASRGEVVCFLDADDMLDPGRLEAVVDALAGGDAGGVVHPLAVYDEEWNELYTLPVGYRPESGWIGARAAARGGRWSVAAGGGVAFRRAVAERVFPIPEDAFTGADADAFVFTLLPLLTPVAHVPQPLYRYRLHGENEGLLRRLDPPSVERRLRFIETTTACVNERLAQLDPPGTALRLEDNLGYEEQRFFLDAFAARRPRAGRDVRFGRLLRRIARDDVYTPARKAGLLLLYSAIVVLPRGSRSGLLSLVRRVSYRARALLRPRAIVLWGLVPAAAVVTMLGIGRESFFLDEVASLSFGRLGTPQLLEVLLEREANSSLYFLLLHPWAGFAEGEAAVRSLSALFAVATVPVLYLLGARLLGHAYGLVAGGLMVVNALFVRFAQQARGYSLVLFLVVAATYAFVLARERRSRLSWAVYAVTIALAAYAHFFALFVLAAHALTSVLVDRMRPRTFAAVYGGALVLVSPLLVFALTRDTGQLSWIPAPSPADVPIVLSLLAGGRTPLGGAVLLGAYAALAGAALWGTWRPGTLEGRHVLLASWVVVPVAGSFAVSFLKPIFQFNYLIVALPGLVLLGAAGAARLRGRWAAALLLVLAGVGAREVYVQHAETNNEQWREVAQLVAAEAEPGDGIAFVAPYGRLPFGYYVDELGLEGRAPVPVRPEMGWALGQTSDDLVSGALAIYPRPADDELLDLAALPHERVWVVLSSDEPGQLARLEESLGAYELVEREAFVDVSVRLYERSRP